MAKPYEPLDGDIEAARRRLLSLSAQACESLDVRAINALSYRIAVYLDVGAGAPTLTEGMMAEIEAEQRRWPSALQ